MTYDGNFAKVYLNGVLRATQTSGANYAGTSFVLGNNPTNQSLGWNGAMQLCGVWSKKLTDGGVGTGTAATGEVAALYNLGAGKDYPFTGT